MVIIQNQVTIITNHQVSRIILDQVIQGLVTQVLLIPEVVEVISRLDLALRQEEENLADKFLKSNYYHV